jgi:hypothetical protein
LSQLWPQRYKLPSEELQKDPRIKFLDRKASTWKRKDSEKCGLALSTKKKKASGI